jgi:hypothetical protein
MSARAIPLLLAVAACTPAPADKSALIAEAKAAIAKELESPASAEFRSVRVAADDGARIIGAVCGEVRGTADQPVDTPFRRFIYAKVNGLATVEDSPATAMAPDLPETTSHRKMFEEFWTDYCG